MASGLTVHAFVPDPTWVRAVAALTGDSITPRLAKLRDGVSISEILGSAAAEFSRPLARNGRVRLIPANLPDDFDPRLLFGDNPEMRPAAKFAL
jgi:hypothetical protein